MTAASQFISSHALALRVRRQRLRECLIEDGSDLYGGGAILDLLRGENRAEANAKLKWCAEWFLRPHPFGRNPRGECDFQSIKLTLAFHLFAKDGLLEPETLSGIETFFLDQDFCSIYQSENHGMMFHTSRHLMAQAYPEKYFTAYGKTGKRFLAEDGEWLKRYIRYRARCGWGEFDSSHYVGIICECLSFLHQFSTDSALRDLSRDMMDLLLADTEVDLLGGKTGGAQGRIYAPGALSHAKQTSLQLHRFYFELDDQEWAACPAYMIGLITSNYVPHPVVSFIAIGRSEPYENRERKHLHNVADLLPEQPLLGSIRKYTYWTPEWIMGCVQYQDPYPKTEIPHFPHHGLSVDPEQRRTAEYARHQQHEWDLTFGTRTDARIFTHHPGTSDAHNHWTGDHGCCCGHFFQNKTALIALYDIPAAEPCQFIHAHLPCAAFDEIVEKAGILFVRAGNAFAALNLLRGYRWITDGDWKGRELVSDGSRHAVICEAGTLVEFGSFALFQRSIQANQVHFDQDRMELEYHSEKAGRLGMDAKGGRNLEGSPADLDYATYDNPFMYSPWQSGRVDLRYGADRLTLDFNEPKPAKNSEQPRS